MFALNREGTHASSVDQIATVVDGHLVLGPTGGYLIGFVIAATLFAGDLSLRQYAGHGLFPMAAPTGGTLLIVSWLAVSVAAVWPQK